MTDPLLPRYQVMIDPPGTPARTNNFLTAESDVSDDLGFLSVRRGPAIAVEQLRLRVLSNVGRLTVRSNGNKYDLQTSAIGTEKLLATHRVEIRLSHPLPQRPKNILWESEAYIDDWEPPNRATALPSAVSTSFNRWEPPEFVVPAYTSKAGVAYPQRTFRMARPEGSTSVWPSGLFVRNFRGSNRLGLGWWQPLPYTTANRMDDLVFRVQVGTTTVTITGTFDGTNAGGVVLRPRDSELGFRRIEIRDFGGPLRMSGVEDPAETMLEAIMTGNYNASIQVYKVDDAQDLEYPLIARMNAGKPTVRNLAVGSQLTWPLRGLMFERLDNPVRTPTADDGSVTLLRPDPGDTYSEIRAVVANLGLTPHYSLANATGGIQLWPYTTPETNREWLTELITIERVRLFETFDNQIGVYNFTDVDKAVDMDTSRLTRPRRGINYHPRSEDDQEIILSRWPEGTAFFRVTGNLVNQINARYGGSTVGATRVSGGVNEPLPQGEVIVR